MKIIIISDLNLIISKKKKKIKMGIWVGIIQYLIQVKIIIVKILGKIILIKKIILIIISQILIII